MQQFFDSLSKTTPLTDKILAATGAAVSGGIGLTLGHVNAVIAILVAGLTALMLIPRVILAWREMLRKLQSDESGEEERGE